MELLNKFPKIKFSPGKTFRWSPRKQIVYYNHEQLKTEHGTQDLLHEIGHAQLGHETYQFDIELINMEVAAWTKARALAAKFHLPIDEKHVDNCLETYRIWLYKRSRCPSCDNTSIQVSSRQYRCFLCNTSWEVAASKTTQPRRMKCFAAQIKIPS